VFNPEQIMHIVNDIGIEQIKRWIATTHIDGHVSDSRIRELAHQAEVRLLEGIFPICQLPPEQTKTNTIANLMISGDGLSKFPGA
jgi:hypothetical protein